MREKRVWVREYKNPNTGEWIPTELVIDDQEILGGFRDQLTDHDAEDRGYERRQFKYVRVEEGR